MTYEEAQDRLDKHAQYCLDGQDLYALEIVLEQSINKSVIEDIKAEILKASWDNYYMPTKLLSCDDVFEIIDKHLNGKE